VETRLVRLKTGEARRGYVLRRYTYEGIKFVPERGWYRVPKQIADYLATVRHVSGDEHSPLAFDVCTEEEARSRDDKESRQERPTLAMEAIGVSTPRGQEEEGKSPASASPRRGRRARKS